MDTDEHGLNEVTEKIIGCVYVVANTLGNGFLEKVFENAFAYELRESNFSAKRQKSIKVYCDGIVVGDYIAGLLVQEAVLVELKAIKMLGSIHITQCLNFLRVAGLKVCILLNFGTPKVQIRRLVDHL